MFLVSFVVKLYC